MCQFNLVQKHFIINAAQLPIIDLFVKNELKTYRPILYASVLSKVFVKVANRLRNHIYSQHLSNDVQSAYKRFHSPETFFLKIHNYIVCNMDNSKLTALT